MLYHLNKYTPKNLKNIEAKNNLVKNIEKFYKGRKKIIAGFKEKIFLINRDETQEEEARYEEEEKNIRNENGLINYKNLARLTDSKIRDISDELVRKYFLVQDLGDLLENLQKSKNKFENNKIQVNLINRGLRDLKEEIEDMSEQEKEIENPYKIVDLVENILEFNKQQQGRGVETLTPDQMLSRLPISLAQLKTGNNSGKLKNEIRQLLYSLYRSKKTYKTTL